MIYMRFKEPHGTCVRCNLNGCQKPVAYDKNLDRVHEFCSKEHAQKAIARGQWPTPIREQSGSTNFRPSGYCIYAGCRLPVFVDPKTQRVHNYCGRTHAKLDANGNSSSSHLGKRTLGSINTSTGNTNAIAQQQLVRFSFVL
jgi:hypothetical protein